MESSKSTKQFLVDKTKSILKKKSGKEYKNINIHQLLKRQGLDYNYFITHIGIDKKLDKMLYMLSGGASGGSGGSASYDPSRTTPAFNMITGTKNSLSIPGVLGSDRSFTIYGTGDGTAWYNANDVSTGITDTTYITPSFYIMGITYTNTYAVFLSNFSTGNLTTLGGGNDATYYRNMGSNNSTFAGFWDSNSGNCNIELWKRDSANISSNWTTTLTRSASFSNSLLSKYTCFVNDGDIIWIGVASTYENPSFTWTKLCKSSEVAGKFITFLWARLNMGGSSNWSQNCQIIRNQWTGTLPWN